MKAQDMYGNFEPNAPPYEAANSLNNAWQQNEIPALGRGVMHVEVHEASAIKGDTLFGHGRASPYVTLRYGHEKKELRSSTHKGGGSSPRWNQTFVYNIMNPPLKALLLHLEIWNYNTTRKDNLLGMVSIENIHEFISKCPHWCTEYLRFLSSTSAIRCNQGEKY